MALKAVASDPEWDLIEQSIAKVSLRWEWLHRWGKRSISSSALVFSFTYVWSIKIIHYRDLMVVATKSLTWIPLQKTIVCNRIHLWRMQQSGSIVKEDVGNMNELAGRERPLPEHRV